MFAVDATVKVTGPEGSAQFGKSGVVTVASTEGENSITVVRLDGEERSRNFATANLT